MSWDKFKNNMLRYMQRQTNVDGNSISISNEIESYDDFAKFLTEQYNTTILSGKQTLNEIPMKTAKTDSMELLIKLSCQKALGVLDGKHNFIDDLGGAVRSYWMGAELMTPIAPIQIPKGAIQNIESKTSLCTNPGEWTDIGKISPVDNSEVFIDRLISKMKMHLTTVEGTYFTTSLYPAGPAVIPLPGIVEWKGWTIPPTRPSVPTPVVETPTDLSLIDTLLLTVAELLEIIPDNNNTVAGAAAVVAATGTEILTDDGEEKNPALVEIQRQSVTDVSPELSDTPDEITPSENVSEEIPSECGVGLNYTTQLSPNLKIRSLSLDVTFPHKIKAAHGLTVDDIVCNLKHMAVNIVEPIMAKYPNVVINSAFRGTPSLVGKVSQHEIGEAIDIQFTGLGPRDYLPISKWIVETLPFDQFIFEHGNSIWLHITCKRIGTNRKKQMTMIDKKYEMGIKCYY
tara:strand:+ start:972 stop:2342 length:1371 start_codon:yes stop_codon:yes gene_type:complete